MTGLKKITLVIAIALVVIQFIRPSQNKSKHVGHTDISNIYSVPQNVQIILGRSCYDCHSYTTRYPWYVNIQPAGWLMANHIKNGKAILNFNDFGTYSPRKQMTKLREIEMSIEDGTMPLSSYLLIHKDARLNLSDKKQITDWIDKTRDSLAQTEEK